MQINTINISLIVQYYISDDRARQEEIDTCLTNNLNNQFLSTIHLLTEQLLDLSQFPHQDKIKQIVIDERLTYKIAFDYTNSVNDGVIWILSNADIYFDDSLKYLKDVNLQNVIYALSRHEVNQDGSITFIDEQYAHGSQDVWIFNTPLDLDEMLTDIKLGVPGCDNRIAYEFLNAGYTIVNPSKIIKCYHLDLTKETDIEKRTSGYGALNTRDSIHEGRVAPPPYQFYIYPTNMIGLEHVDAYKEMQKKLFELTGTNDELRSLYQQIANVHIQLSEINKQMADRDQHIADRDQQIADRDQQIADRDQQIADRDQQIADRDQQIVSFINSLSWKITLPFRIVLDFINKNH